MIARRTWIGTVRGAHPKAAPLLVHVPTPVERLRANCSCDDGSMAALDPSVAQTGCQSLSADAQLLPGAPMSGADSAMTLRLRRPQ